MKHFLKNNYRLWILVSIAIWGFAFSGAAQPAQTTNRVNTGGSSNAVARIETDEGVEVTVQSANQLSRSVLTFGLDRVPGLNRKIWGNPAWQYIASLLYVVLAFYASKFVDWLLRVWVRKWTEKTSTTLDDLVVELLHGPTKILSFVVLLHLGLNMFAWPRWLSSWRSP
jgi:hypothetical protein